MCQSENQFLQIIFNVILSFGCQLLYSCVFYIECIVNKKYRRFKINCFVFLLRTEIVDLFAIRLQDEFRFCNFYSIAEKNCNSAKYEVFSFGFVNEIPMKLFVTFKVAICTKSTKSFSTQ